MNTLMPILEASLRGALLIGVLALLRVPLRRLIGSPWFCALWIVVLVRLMVPGSIQSSWSAFNWWPQAKARPVESQPLQARVTVLPVTATTAETETVSAPLAAQSSRNDRPWLMVAWLAGAAATSLMFGWRILKTARMAALTQPADHPKLLAAFDSIEPELRGNVLLRQAANLNVPALVGLWRPQIWVPESWLGSMSEEDLRHVLLHELGHARRGDLWVQWAFALVQCVHWFNPAVWLAARLAHADRELACDAWVLRRANADEPERYGATLVKAAQMLRSQWHLPPAAITMAMSKGSLISRVRSIGQFRPIASWRAIIGSAATALLLGSIATDRVHAQGGTAPSGIPGQPAPAAGTPPPNAPIGGGAGTSGAFDGGFALEGSDGSKTIVGSGTLSVRMPGPQVEIEARFFEMNESGWKAQGLGGLSAPLEDQLAVRGVIGPSGLHAFLARVQSAPGGGLDLLSAPRVTTRSGQRAVIEIIREVRYAIEFERDDKGVDGLTPTSFETRNVGVTLEAEPTVNFDGQSVDVLLVPQIVELTGFIRVRTGAPVPITPDPTKGGLGGLLDATLPTDMVVQPIFSTRKVSTSVSLHSGQTLVLGGLKQATAQAGAEPRVLFILITARILNNGTAQTGAASPSPAGDAGAAIFGGGGGGRAVISGQPLPTIPGLPGAGTPPVPPGGIPGGEGLGVPGRSATPAANPPVPLPGGGIPGGAGAPLPTPPIPAPQQPIPESGGGAPGGLGGGIPGGGALRPGANPVPPPPPLARPTGAQPVPIAPPSPAGR